MYVVINNVKILFNAFIYGRRRKAHIVIVHSSRAILERHAEIFRRFFPALLVEPGAPPGIILGMSGNLGRTTDLP
jgi:hypothetical protein